MNLQGSSRADDRPLDPQLTPLNLSPAPGHLIAFHGWGLGPGYWQRWADLCQGSGWLFSAYDRGYFCTGSLPTSPLTFTPGVPWRGILAHSYGLHLCPPSLWQEANFAIVWGGFPHFHPLDPALGRSSRRRLQQMIRQCDRQPQAVLQQFWHQTAAPEPWDPASLGRSLGPPPWGEWNITRLVQDLQDLDRSHFTPPPLPLLWFHGAEDAIVPPALGQELGRLWQSQGDQRVTGYLMPQAGHGLPWSHASWCWQQMIHWLCP